MVDGHIVVSSSWRHDHTLDELREIFRNNGLDEERVIGVTPSTAEQTGNENYCRGHEIAAWLRENPAENYLILDDEPPCSPTRRSASSRPISNPASPSSTHSWMQ
jgi:hypothetical protein